VEREIASSRESQKPPQEGALATQTSKPKRLTSQELQAYGDVAPPPGAITITQEQANVLSQKPPTFGAYLLLLAFPVIGFLLPWGAIRALSWVLSGFSNAK
jgi:hypothetical protein